MQSAVERYAALPGVCVVHLRGVEIQQRDSEAGNRWLLKCLASCPQALVRILEHCYNGIGGLQHHCAMGPEEEGARFTATPCSQ